jgi:hypothetical protein
VEDAPFDRNPPRRRARKPFDPLRDNGPVFVDWPRPRLALVITGRQDGYLEPCGCVGLDRVRGGLGRRHSLIESLRARGWPLVLLDVGGLSRRIGVQALLKFRVSTEALAQMGYDAIALGTAELRFPVADLASLVAAEEGRPGCFISANVAVFSFSSEITPRHRILQAAGVRLGVTSILGNSYRRQVHNPDLQTADAETALAEIAAIMRPACDLMILLAHATREESIALARRFPAFDIVVTSDGAPVPPAEPTRIDGGKTWLIDVGEKVKDAIVLGLFDDPGQQRRYQRVPLDSRFSVSPEMKKRMARYVEEVGQLGLDGLGVRSIPNPSRAVQGDYLGSDRCAACHEASYGAWKKSAHARAARNLAEQDPPRQFDPECIACHMTGWHPQGGVPYEGGYLGPDTTPGLASVGCESCHGPGGAHAAAEAGTNQELKRKLQKTMVLSKGEAKRRVCTVCHDVSNSPDFDFDAYWPDIAHPQDR